jgi:predicted secreted protein
MATKVKGNDVILSVRDGDDFKPVACSISCEITSEADLVEITTKNSGYWKEWDYQVLSWKATCDGVIILDDESTKASLFLLLETQHNFLEMIMQCTIQDTAGNAKTITGRILIPSVVFSGAVDDFARHQETFQGTGGLLITDGLSTSVTVTLRAQGQDGTTGTINSAVLVDDIGIEYILLPSPLSTAVYPAFNTHAATVPSGVYKLRVSVTTSALGPALEAHTFSHDALPGDARHPGPSGTTTYYPTPEPIWDFSVDRTITLVTGAS